MTATTIFWKSSRSILQFVIGMAEKGQTEANCNLENTNKIANEVGERREEEKGNNDDANVNCKDFQDALDCRERDLKISREVEGRQGKGRAYCNHGNAYDSLGDFQKATEYHEQNLKISKELGDRAGKGRSYSDLGNPFKSRGDF